MKYSYLQARMTARNEGTDPPEAKDPGTILRKGAVLIENRLKKVLPALKVAADKAALSLQDVATIASIESSFVPTAINGSYKGLFQLSDRALNFSRIPSQNWSDPMKNSIAGGNWLAQMRTEIGPFLAAYGETVTPQLLYAAHNLGGPSFKSAYRAWKTGTSASPQARIGMASQHFSKGSTDPATYFRKLDEVWSDQSAKTRVALSAVA